MGARAWVKKVSSSQPRALHKGQSMLSRWRRAPHDSALRKLLSDSCVRTSALGIHVAMCSGNRCLRNKRPSSGRTCPVRGPPAPPIAMLVNGKGRCWALRNKRPSLCGSMFPEEHSTLSLGARGASRVICSLGPMGVYFADTGNRFHVFQRSNASAPCSPRERAWPILTVTRRRASRAPLRALCSFGSQLESPSPSA